uniref:Uncharacterized protein n=1 Tax=Caenorhabditis elegans TaxID=6239 RepID=A0A5E4LZE3_CAEEL
MPEKDIEKVLENLQLDILIMAWENDMVSDQAAFMEEELLKQNMISQHLKIRNEFLPLASVGINDPR